GIFQNYAEQWTGKNGTSALLLSENFRSAERLLEFINSLFSPLMTRNFGGTDYDELGRLGFGAAAGREHLRARSHPTRRVEVMLSLTGGSEAAEEDRTDVEREARLVAMRLKELKGSGHQVWDRQLSRLRPVEWHDVVILLRAPRGKI